MNVEDLKRILNMQDYNDQAKLPVSVLISKPSVGPRAVCNIESAHFGFDWDRGLLLTPISPLVIKQQNESAFDLSVDLLMYLATKPTKKKSYETKRARKILQKAGYTEQRIDELSKYYHKVK